MKSVKLNSFVKTVSVLFTSYMIILAVLVIFFK